ncbi:MAG: LLM class flavin-dependent oxidoreductase [Pseudomonadota bacterium]|nr:LLM class flavin-dependent oxidoreductase [Pseudomonadota bacterium]
MTDTIMHLGLFMMPLHPPSRTLSETLAEDTEKSIYADKLGYEELWMGEHFTATTEPFAAPLMFLANLITQTENLKFATGVINLPNHHPAVVAGEVAQFDHMSGGNFIFGIGPGGLISDFELFGNLDGEIRGRKFAECIDMILKIWSGGPPFDLDGEFWSVKIQEGIIDDLGIGHMAKPLQQPHPPIALSIASPHSASAGLAARRGWSIVSANISPVYSVKSHWDIYKAAMEDTGHPADGNSWRVARNLLVARTEAEAEDRVFAFSASSRYYFTYMHGVFSALDYLILVKPDPDMADADCTPDVIVRECVTYGSPETILDKLIAFRDHVGPFETLLHTGADWGGPNEEWERQSMRLLAEEVMPRFCQHVASEKILT